MNSMRGGEESRRLVVNEEMAEGGAAREWVMEMNKELEEVGRSRAEESKRWRAASIYRIPVQGKAYRPQMVAVGPYHHGEEQLEEMEEHKKRALHTFLERSAKPLQFYVDALAPVEQDLKNAYYHPLPPHFNNAHNFLKLIILDACFMLELMRISDDPEGYATNDPIFSKHGNLYFRPLLRRDMLMLENQLPLLALTKLVDAQGGVDKQNELSKRINEFLETPRRIQKLGNYLHLLDLYRKSLLLPMPNKTQERPESEVDKVQQDCSKKECNIRSATELTEAGIRFEKSETSHLDDISFGHCGGVLKLPRIKVDDTSEYLYLNLMAFERLHVDAGNEVTSYVFFMDRLIDSARDVSLLHWRGVVENSLGSDGDVAALFNSLSTDMCLDPDSVLFGVQRQVADYYRKPLPRCMAFAQHNYFTNPWVGLSIVAAIFLFALTITQTVYAVLDYYNN